ncbi:hypothetical protein [Micromonospora sp. NPDC023814]|uniref:RICIN domain-containing protein n=1 Tax=Micromonospora sp. NPDC023814 TaxID=3154596 RepID=UPI003410A087
MSVPNDRLVDPQVVPSVTKSWRPRHRVLAFVVALMVGAFSAITVASPAQAWFITANMVRNLQTGWCLDSNWAGDVYTLPCSLPMGTNPHQVWEVHGVMSGLSDPVVQLKNKATGRCLDTIYGDNPRTVTLDGHYCPTGVTNTLPPAYVWRTFFFATGSKWNSVQFKSYMSTSYCLDSNYGDVYSFHCNGGNWQNWKLGY